MSVLGIDLIYFIPTEEDEVIDLNTIFSDRVKQRIIKRTKKKVNTRGKTGVMVTEKVVVHGTNKDLKLIASDGVATTLATEDNVDRIMTYLEQS